MSFKAFLTLIILIFVFPGTQFTLGDPGESRVDSLLRTLETAEDFKVRIAAANALGKVSNGTVADWILRAFRKEDNSAVRLAMLYAVGQIPEAMVLPPLLELNSEELLSEFEILTIERVIWNYRLAVDKQGWTRELLEGSDREERGTAAYLLGLVGDRSILPVLMAAAKDSQSSVRLRAVQAIGRIGSLEGLNVCKRAAQQEQSISVKKAAETCMGSIELLRAGRVPKEKNWRVPLKIDLYGLEPSGLTPELVRAYRKRNMNPRALDQALATLRAEKVQVREDRSISLIRTEDARQTIKFNVRLFTLHNFPKADLDRLREVVKENIGYVNQCYLKALKTNRTLRGDVKAQIQVLSSGSVANVEIVDFTLPEERVRACIVEKLRELKFPEIPIKYVTMKYTFNFVPPKDEKFEFGGADLSAEQRKPGAKMP